MDRKSILIVEDEQIPAVDLKDTLISLGYRVPGIAKSGEMAVEMADEYIPDLILMDIRLSGKLSGIEAAEQILLRHSIPIIYLTAYADPELVEQAKKTRPYGYLIKPYDERAIRTEIDIAFYKVELDRNLEREYANLEQRVIERTNDLTRMNAALIESEEKYRTILENMQDLFYRTDLKGRITMVSPAGARMAGYDSPDQLVGTDIAAMYAEPEKREQLLSVLEKDGTVSDYPLTLKDHDGSVRYGLTNSHFYRDAQGTIQGVEGIIHDITGLRQAEDALRMANKKLSLLSGITRHDIRNHLMALKSYIYLSRDAMDNPGKLAEFLKKEEMITDIIERQINFTHDYEEMGVKSPVWQNVEAMISSVVSQLPLREIRVETACPGLGIYADPLLEKVFYNIIDNALRYGGEKMTVIHISSQIIGSGLVVSIGDDGVGIPAEDKNKLFERGFGHHTGLGLFLSREILSITGITITETGEPGTGARFEILVPNSGYRFSDAADNP
jgi:PAS domain S-box-containing protein